MTHKINDATAVYTGGGIYIYYGQLEDGNYFRTWDDAECIEICDADTSVEEADYNEFYDEHRVETLIEDEFKVFWNKMIQWIIDNEPNGNYAVDELKERMEELKINIELTNEEILILSDGLLSLIHNMNEARRLVVDTKTRDCMEETNRKYRDLNGKICMMLKE